MRFQVVCPDGRRSVQRFDSHEEAYQYADWGHTCLAADQHLIVKANRRPLEDPPDERITRAHDEMLWESGQPVPEEIDLRDLRGSSMEPPTRSDERWGIV